jgi:hypothetical protein
MNPPEAPVLAFLLQATLLAPTILGLICCRRLPAVTWLPLFFANGLAACTAIFAYIRREGSLLTVDIGTSLTDLQRHDLVQSDQFSYLALSLLCACAGIACCLLMKAGKSRP